MIDSHAHLDDERFNEDREEVIKNLKRDNVDYVVNIGADIESSRNSVDLADKCSNIYATVGIHPHDAKTYTDEMEEELIKLSENKKVVAIGEIGLDFYYDNSPRDVQQIVFERQIKMASRLGKNVVIHSREAVKQTFDTIKTYHKNFYFKALIHCFTQSVEMMEEYVKMGDYIALGGAVTFKNSRVPKEVARVVPLDRLLLETDSPYMTPEPYRGKRNEPKYVNEVAKFIADLRDMDVKELIEITDKNTKDFYGIK